MITKKVNRYFCEFCRKGKFSAPWIRRHEAHCYKNPSRVPYEGELSYIGLSGVYRDFSDSDGPWHEWVPFDPTPAWWPGEGKIFHDEKWHDVPGYKLTPAPPGHGCAGGACPVEEWPKCGHPEGLHKIPAAYRWEALYPAH
jgi:hypothetical protein